MPTRWHILRDGSGLTLCRHVPPRFDVSARTWLPWADPVRLAHQIRQDVWRALQRLRGFSPVVQMIASDDGWTVLAGGRAFAPVPVTVNAQIAAQLANPRNRERWLRNAQRRGTHG